MNKTPVSLTPAVATCLNSEQQSVVSDLEGHSLIIAGAGTGKTHTLVHKVIQTLKSGVLPSSVLLLTFTNKAAGEMTERVEQYLGYPVLGLMSGTFHSVGARMLRTYGKHVDVPSGFTIMDADDSKTLLDHIRKELKLDQEQYFPRKNVLYEIASLLRNLKCDLETLLLERYPDWIHFKSRILGVMDQYRDLKQKSGQLDFDDLLEKWRDILKDDSICCEIQHQYPHVFVDEYQDTNQVQNEIIRCLTTTDTHLTVVGDDAQSIYSFRGARFENILDFERVFPGTKVYKLQINYRSTPAILNYANGIIASNTRQVQKVLRADKERPGPIPVVYRYHDENEQCQAVASMIRERIRNGVHPKNIAVFYRAHSQSMTMQVALSRMGIAFEVTSGLRFFEQAHIKDVMAYIRVLSNPNDLVSWMRIVRMLPGVGEKTAAQVLGIVKQNREGALLILLSKIEARLPKKARIAWREMFCVLKGMGEKKLKSPELILNELLESSFFYDYIRSTYENADYREDDLEQLQIFSKPYKELETFLSEMTLASERYRKQESESPVLLSTVHQSKGLEWDHVFVIWMAEGRFPFYRAYDSIIQMEEERRLFYVAATRARFELILGFPEFDEQARSGNVYLKPSRFIVDIDQSRYQFCIYDEM